MFLQLGDNFLASVGALFGSIKKFFFPFGFVAGHVTGPVPGFSALLDPVASLKIDDITRFFFWKASYV